MKQSWRWFGPHDLTRLTDIRQAGATDVVSALHHIASGVVWTPDEIAKRQTEVSTLSDGSDSGLTWSVIESLVVSEDIKKQKGELRAHYANYCESLENIAAAGIEVVCYNFMPVLDWTRTDLRWRLPHGGTAMRFDVADFALFDIHLLERGGAAGDYPADIVAEAARRFASLPDARSAELISNIVAGLPGANEHLTLAQVREHLAEYDHISAEQLRANLVDFLSEVVPTAERLGLRLCCHPDDPPFALMGLPRVMSTAEDYAKVLDAVVSPANGMTLCTGSFGARADNDLPAIAKQFAAKIHFVHLRNVTRDGDAEFGSFFEDGHLSGGTDMVAVIAALLAEERRRASAGRTDAQIPMRPDHGQDIVDDLNRTSQPGYPTVGRLKGLAELRGVMAALDHADLGMR